MPKQQCVSSKFGCHSRAFLMMNQELHHLYFVKKVNHFVSEISFFEPTLVCSSSGPLTRRSLTCNFGIGHRKHILKGVLNIVDE